MFNVLRQKRFHYTLFYRAVRKKPTVFATTINNILRKNEIPANGTLSSFSNYSVISFPKDSVPSERTEIINVRKFSTQKSGDSSTTQGGDKNEPPDEPQTSLPASVVVPEVWPQVPLIAINRNPVFPRFIKLVEVNTV